MKFVDRVKTTLASVPAEAGSGKQLTSLRKARSRINRPARLRARPVPSARNIPSHDLGERISRLEALVKPLLEHVNKQSTLHQLPSSTTPQPQPKEIENIDRKIEQAEKILGYMFKDKALCAEALQMAGTFPEFAFNGGSHCVSKNKTLAIVGDSVMTYALCKKWWLAGGRYRAADFLDTIRRQVLSNNYLGIRGYELGIGSLILAGPYRNKSYRGGPSIQMLATTVEALFGAVSIDAGVNDSEAAITATLERLELHKHPSI